MRLRGEALKSGVAGSKVWKSVVSKGSFSFIPKVLWAILGPQF